MVSEEEKGRTRNRCNMEGYETVALFPFRNEGEIFGLIHVADHRENMVPPNVVKMLKRPPSNGYGLPEGANGKQTSGERETLLSFSFR